jgi:hypothetical protein
MTTPMIDAARLDSMHRPPEAAGFVDLPFLEFRAILTTMKAPLYSRLYFQPAMYEAARIIDYAGISAPEFWKKAQSLGIAQEKLQAAVEELTNPEPRQQEPPRYELTPEVRQLCWQLLGPEPGHPDYERMGRKSEAAAGSFAGKVKKPRGRKR